MLTTGCWLMSVAEPALPSRLPASSDRLGRRSVDARSCAASAHGVELDVSDQASVYRAVGYEELPSVAPKV
jgi:hypothetical protein